MKTTTIHIKMNIAFLKIWCHCLPYLYFWIELFNFAPCGISDASAMSIRRNKKQFQVTMYIFDLYNHTPYFLTIPHNSVGYAIID